MSMLLGEGAPEFRIRMPFDGMLVAALPPGAFFGLAVLLALRNWAQDRRAERAAGTAAAAAPASGSST
jgi:electron transport complex protein RnfE